MKKKLWIKARVFLSFSIFIIIIINIFAYLLYYFVSENIKYNTQKSILNEFETIKTFIDLQSSSIFSLPKYEIEKISNLWFYFYIWNNDKDLQRNYKIWFKTDENTIVFRGDYKWFNIIIWKNTQDFNNFKKSFIEILISLNIFIILSIFLLSYFITSFSLKPLLKLSSFLNNYKNLYKHKLIKNNYPNTEIWDLTDAINNFIKQNKEILESQIDFIQDVNHELKTPLMQIESNIELIENKIKNKKTKERLKSIKYSIYNINEIISNLWFILRWEKIIKKKEKIIMSNYFSNLIKKYKELAEKKDIKIKIVKNYDLVIENNTYYLDRLFWNILSNSILYNNWNNIIYIIIEKNKIKIKDNWIWIEQSEIKKIFNRFYRNKNSSIFFRDWNWLWLSIVKKICNMFWWQIDIKSEIWKETIFTILL